MTVTRKDIQAYLKGEVNEKKVKEIEQAIQDNPDIEDMYNDELASPDNNLPETTAARIIREKRENYGDDFGSHEERIRQGIENGKNQGHSR